MVTVFAQEQRNAGEYSAIVPVSAGAVGVHLTVICDLTASNSFRLEYHDGIKRRMIAVLHTPTDLDDSQSPVELMCELRPPNNSLAGQSVPVFFQVTNAGSVGLDGEPIF